jgi:hypothetical protein
VVWRVGDGAASCGKLEIHDDALILSGASAPQGLRISLDEVTSVTIGRRPEERIGGVPSLVVERRRGERVLAYVFGSVAALSELREVISACVQATAAC